MTKEELIKKHLEGWSGLQKASIEHFAESGKASGSFFMALKAMLDEYAGNAVKNISSNLPVMPSFLALRKKAGMTLREVETATGISNAYLSQLETGKIDNPSYKIVRTLINHYANAKNGA